MAVENADVDSQAVVLHEVCIKSFMGFCVLLRLNFIDIHEVGIGSFFHILYHVVQILFWSMDQRFRLFSQVNENVSFF